MDGVLWHMVRSCHAPQNSILNASSYTSHLMRYKQFWNPLGIQDSTDHNQVANKSSSIHDQWLLTHSYLDQAQNRDSQIFIKCLITCYWKEMVITSHCLLYSPMRQRREIVMVVLQVYMWLYTVMCGHRMLQMVICDDMWLWMVI